MTTYTKPLKRVLDNLYWTMGWDGFTIKSEQQESHLTHTLTSRHNTTLLVERDEVIYTDDINMVPFGCELQPRATINMEQLLIVKELCNAICNNIDYDTVIKLASKRVAKHNIAADNCLNLVYDKTLNGHIVKVRDSKGVLRYDVVYTNGCVEKTHLGKVKRKKKR